MTITLVRNGNTTSNGDIFPHDRKYPSLFVATSTNKNSYIDFKFCFTISDINGTIATIYNTTGVFDSSKYISKSLDSNEYSDSTGTYSILNEYAVHVQEYYNNALQGASYTFDKACISLRKDNYDGAKYPFPYKDISKLPVTDALGLDLRQDKETTAMISLYSQSTTSYLWYEVLFKNGIKWKYKYYTTGAYTFIGTTINSTANSGEFIPIGYKDLLTTSIETYGYTENGVWHSSVAIVTGITDVSNATTPIEFWMYSPLDITKKVHYKLTSCDNKIITLHWLNYYGGYEFYNFNKYRTDILTTKKEFYDSAQYSSSYLMENDKASKRMLKSDEEYKFELYSNILTDDEIKYLKSLWISDKVYIDIDGEQRPCIILDASKEVYKENKKLFQYKLNVMYAVN